MQYANWTDVVTGKLDKKQREALAKKLKTYVNSTKFLRLGSKVDALNLVTGALLKRPIANVTYYKDPKSAGITALQLLNKIRQALLNKDSLALKLITQYRYYNADVAPNAKLLAAKQKLKSSRKLVALALLLGGTGAAAGASMPLFIDNADKKYNDAQMASMYLNSGLTGGTLGLTAAGLIHSLT